MNTVPVGAISVLLSSGLSMTRDQPPTISQPQESVQKTGKHWARHNRRKAKRDPRRAVKAK